MPLSVLQVASGCPNWGGTELHILSLSDQLRQRGHDVTVACQPGRFVEDRAHQLGLKTFPLSVRYQYDHSQFGAIRRFIKANKIDVVHVHWSSDAIVHGHAALRERVPVRVLSRHMPYPFKTRLGTLLYSRLLFTRMVTVSNSVRDTIIRCGVAPHLVEVIHHGTDIAAFANTTASPAEVRLSLGIPSDRVAVGIIGRIALEKGHMTLLEAAKRIGDSYPLTYVVVGNGPHEDMVRAEVARQGLDERVIFAGFREDVNNVMNGLDVVVVPSTWNEPCSAVVQQAMSLSKPVIGTRVGGTPEMIVDGQSGLLIPTEDAGALADAITDLARDAFHRKRMGLAGRDRVEAHFSLSGMTDKIEALYYNEYQRSRQTGAEPRVATS